MSEQVQEDSERTKLWTEFANDAFRLGQITMQIEQTKGQLAKLEKDHEVAIKKARGSADRHDKYVQTQQQAPVQAPSPAPEVTQ